ncbi:MAG: hypothetical protein M5U31_16330 [Acidimicrobiia bacterium]|nr:hypothetical protein [Acidimicrobiia bacterium]
MSLYTAATAARLARLGRRGGASDVAGIVSLGFDFDVGDETLAREVLRRAALDPGLVVHSGGGIHVWVLLDRPLMFTSADARDRWSTVVRAVWEAVDAVVRDMGVADRFRGGKLDPTFDLPRVLGLGGTLNYKQREP